MSPLRNKVSLIGRVSSTIDTVFAKIQFTITTMDNIKTDEGKWITEPTEHIIHASGSIVKRIEPIQKGQELIIEGRIVNEPYRTDKGIKVGKVIELQEFLILSPKLH